VQKAVYNSFGLNHLRRYGPVCRESSPYPKPFRMSVYRLRNNPTNYPEGARVRIMVIIDKS
jgi:hypothetical protein